MAIAFYHHGRNASASRRKISPPIEERYLFRSTSTGLAFSGGGALRPLTRLIDNLGNAEPRSRAVRLLAHCTQMTFAGPIDPHTVSGFAGGSLPS